MQVTPVPFTLALIFTIAVVLSIVIQGAVFLGLFLIARTTIKKLMGILDEVKGKALPIVGDVRGIVQDVTPKVKTISGHLVEISETVRDQTKHVNSTVGEVVDKTRVQAGKVDEMVSAVLTSISHAGSSVSAGVAKPARKVSSVLNGLRVTLESVFGHKNKPVSRSGAVYTTVDEDATARYSSTGQTVSPLADQTIHPPPTTSSSL